MQIEAAVRRDRLVDREPPELVTKRHSRVVETEHARREALLQVVDSVAGQRCEEPCLCTRRDDRDQLEQRAGGVVETGCACKDCIPQRGGDLESARPEDLDDVERVARRPAVKFRGIDAVRLGELRHRSDRKRLEPDAFDASVRRQLTQCDAHRMACVQFLFAEARDDQAGKCPQPPGEESKDVERRFVRPVHVLEDEDALILARELLHESRSDVVGSRTACERAPERTAETLADVEQWSRAASA